MSINNDGRILLPNGVSYRVLVLPETDRMTLPVLRKLRALVGAGATLIGPKPLKSPSLAGYPECDDEIRAIASEVWGDLDGISRTRRTYGKGVVSWGVPLAELLGSLATPKDVDYSRGFDSDLVWSHRRDGNTDIYFVVNRSDNTHD